MSLLVFQPALKDHGPQLRHTHAWLVLMPAAPVKGRAGALVANLATTSYLILALVSPPAGLLSSLHPMPPACHAMEAVANALDLDQTTA